MRGQNENQAKGIVGRRRGSYSSQFSNQKMFLAVSSRLNEPAFKDPMPFEWKKFISRLEEMKETLSDKQIEYFPHLLAKQGKKKSAALVKTCLEHNVEEEYDYKKALDEGLSKALPKTIDIFEKIAGKKIDLVSQEVLDDDIYKFKLYKGPNPKAALHYQENIKFITKQKRLPKEHEQQEINRYVDSMLQTYERNPTFKSDSYNKFVISEAFCHVAEIPEDMLDIDNSELQKLLTNAITDAYEKCEKLGLEKEFVRYDEDGISVHAASVVQKCLFGLNKQQLFNSESKADIFYPTLSEAVQENIIEMSKDYYSDEEYLSDEEEL